MNRPNAVRAQELLMAAGCTNLQDRYQGMVLFTSPAGESMAADSVAMARELAATFKMRAFSQERNLTQAAAKRLAYLGATVTVR
jgi:hypothetical protein